MSWMSVRISQGLKPASLGEEWDRYNVQSTPRFKLDSKIGWGLWQWVSHVQVEGLL